MGESESGLAAPIVIKVVPQPISAKKSVFWDGLRIDQVIGDQTAHEPAGVNGPVQPTGAGQRHAFAHESFRIVCLRVAEQQGSEMVTRGPGKTVAFRSRTLGAGVCGRWAQPWVGERRYLWKNLGATTIGNRVFLPRVVAQNVWPL